MLVAVLMVVAFALTLEGSEAISAYWTPILPSFCSGKVPPNVTQALLNCDQLMDQQLGTIFDSCVRSVLRLKEEHLKVGKPRLCYYMRSGTQLDRCKMMRYRKEGIGLNDLVDREQEHTWCLMKIAQPLGWERLCSDHANDVAFNLARQSAIQACESRFQTVTTPIKECFNEAVAGEQGGGAGPAPSVFAGGWQFDQMPAPNSSLQMVKPAACLSFQYSRKIWKCLARKESNKSLQRQSNQYIACLRAIRHSSGSSLKPIKNQLLSNMR